MDLDLVFLGTSGSAPTASRAPAALLVRRGGDRLLFDCGEGTQRQLMRSTVGLPDIEEIFITHYHGDHYLGLPGMLKTFQLRQRELPLTVYGPPGLRDLFGGLRRVFGKVRLSSSSSWRCGPGEALERDELPHPRLPRRPRNMRPSAMHSSSTSVPGASTTTRPMHSGFRSGRSGGPCSMVSR